MPVDSVGSSTGAEATKITGRIQAEQQLNQEDFLKLLVTQMTNQDPLSPSDDKTFIAQMAQFSSVEGINGMTKSLANMNAAGLLGKTVTVTQQATPGATDATGTVQQITGPVSAVKFKADGAYITVNARDYKTSDIAQVGGN